MRWIFVLWLLMPRLAEAASFDFAGLSPGTRLSTQLPGLGFAPGAVVVQSPSGHVLSFNDFPGCEFCPSQGKVSFTELQQTVTAHVGLLPNPAATLTRSIRLVALNTAGAPVATGIVSAVSGAGFVALVRVSTPTAQIAAATLDIVDDDTSSTIGLADLELQTVAPAGPDFSIEAPPGWSLLSGAPATDVPIRVRRFGGSTGPINFSASALPVGVHGTFTPGPADTVSWHLSADSDVSSIAQVTLIATPSSALAGSAPHSVSVALSAVPRLRVQGPSALDFSGCSVSGADGAITGNYTVIRDHRVSGPVSLQLESLPNNVSGTVSPASLDFAAGAIGQKFSVRLTTVAGPVVPDHALTLRVSGAGSDLRLPILAYGACPQQNRNFRIQGNVRVLSENTNAALRGAQVEIFRYRSDWYDDKVGDTETDRQGYFSLDLDASIEGEYYARVRLNNPRLNYVEALNSSVWSQDTARQSNASGLIDVGTVTLSRDDPSESHPAGIWQAFREDLEDFDGFGALSFVPGGFLGIVEYRGHLTPLTFYDEVHWPHEFRGSASRHEFGHVLRHSLDGDGNHWNQDNFEYLYGRSHTHCTQDAVANAGYGFNEGWADVWAGRTSCCPDDTTNPYIQGTVAHSLGNLSQCPGVGRGGLLRVLARGENLIHSEGQFRDQFALEFPGCPLPAIDANCTANRPSGGGCDLRPPLAARPRERLEPLTSTDQLQKDIAAVERWLTKMHEQSSGASGVKAILMGSSLAEAELVLQQLRRKAAEPETGEQHLQRGFVALWEREQLFRQRMQLRLRALDQALLVPGAPYRDIERQRIRLANWRLEDSALEPPFLRIDLGENELEAKRPRAPKDWIVFAGVVFMACLTVALLRSRRRSRAAA